MADKKITDLTELAVANIADTDMFEVADVSVPASKKYGFAAMKTDILAGLLATDRNVIGWKRIVSITAPVTNNNATPNTLQDVTGLQFPVVAGETYGFRFTIAYTADATTTGSRWTLNGPAVTNIRYKTEFTLTTTALTFGGGFSGYDVGSVNATSIVAANIAIIEGVIKPSASGNVIARFSCEVAGPAFIQAEPGSYVEFVRLA